MNRALIPNEHQQTVLTSLMFLDSPDPHRMAHCLSSNLQNGSAVLQTTRLASEASLLQCQTFLQCRERTKAVSYTYEMLSLSRLLFSVQLRCRRQLKVVEGGAEALKVFAEEGTGDDAVEGWKELLSLFKANSRDELVTLLGFSKAEIADHVAQAVENLKVAEVVKSPLVEERDDIDGKSHEPVISFAEPEHQEAAYESMGSDGDRDEKTPSEVSASINSDATSGTRLADSESTTTAPSLFGEDSPGTPQLDLNADFFSTISQANILVPHMNYGIDSSIAATMGSGPLSVTSETTKSGPPRSNAAHALAGPPPPKYCMLHSF